MRTKITVLDTAVAHISTGCLRIDSVRAEAMAHTNQLHAETTATHAATNARIDTLHETTNARIDAMQTTILDKVMMHADKLHEETMTLHAATSSRVDAMHADMLATLNTATMRIEHAQARLDDMLKDHASMHAADPNPTPANACPPPDAFHSYAEGPAADCPTSDPPANESP